MEQRRIGVEQEFFLVDGEGTPSNRAGEFLTRCRKKASEEDLSPACFVGEVSGSMVEVNTPPARTVADLAEAYLASLDLALRSGRELDVRLCPLSTYPLPVEPVLRGGPDYEFQARTVGHRRFLHAARCTGVHLHLELPEGTLDPDAVISLDAPTATLQELLNLYNLATALDPALVALSRASPFYDGKAPGFAVRTAYYRGSALLGCEGLYTHLPEVGDLRPYAKSVRELVERQLAGYEAWLAAMDRAGVDRRLFFEAGGNALKASWNPVRLNQKGTVELRSIDSNYPEVVLAIAALVLGAASRVRSDGLTVEPDDLVRVFEVEGEYLHVPGFAYLGGSLFHAAATKGAENPEVSAYLDSVFEFAGPEDWGSRYLAALRTPAGLYRTTEADILSALPRTIHLSTDEGLRLVREACDEFERQVSHLRQAAQGQLEWEAEKA
ncbi:MAG: glutamate-cysteine ligase family protein [Actinomycetota bacterium]|nr:glutamate-cysteine ligase family protein [Actinomycetota bacterium]